MAPMESPSICWLFLSPQYSIRISRYIIFYIFMNSSSKRPLLLIGRCDPFVCRRLGLRVYVAKKNYKHLFHRSRMPFMCEYSKSMFSISLAMAMRANMSLRISVVFHIGYYSYPYILCSCLRNAMPMWWISHRSSFTLPPYIKYSWAIFRMWAWPTNSSEQMHKKINENTKYTRHTHTRVPAQPHRKQCSCINLKYFSCFKIRSSNSCLIFCFHSSFVDTCSDQRATILKSSRYGTHRISQEYADIRHELFVIIVDIPPNLNDYPLIMTSKHERSNLSITT